MPGIFRDRRLQGDIEGLLSKYSSLNEDVEYLENLLRDGRIPSRRCGDFIPNWVWRVDVQISALEGRDAEDRCTLVYERDGAECYVLLLYDNDAETYESMKGEIINRRSGG